MTIAEIRGKLSSSGSNISDRLEDLLTADVFGCLRYLPFDQGFEKILTRAQCYADSEQLCIKNDNDDVKIDFWPRLENNSEPDVLICNKDHLIVIEVKYLSGKSGHYGANKDYEDSMEAAGSDQLARLFQGLMSYEGHYGTRSLIYLTAHRNLPENDIKAGYDALNELSDDNRHKYEKHIYWLSWFEVYKAVSGALKEDLFIHDKYRQIVLCDIQRLLHRKGLRQFYGFEGIIGKCIPITAFYKETKTYYWNVQPVEPIEQPAFYCPRP